MSPPCSSHNHNSSSGPRSERAQAAVELLAMLPILLVLALLVLQALAIALTFALAQLAAQRADSHVSPAQTLPAPWSQSAEMTTASGTATVQLDVPQILPFLQPLHVSAEMPHNGIVNPAPPQQDVSS